MKQEKNNEIDLLLRFLAKGGRHESLLDGGKVSAREDGALSDHLDADELNSFAEGVVPAPARARFIAHLADCQSCRGSVINLTQASGAAAGSGTFEQETGAGFWHKMAALFSPPVLRYAVPALALTAVLAVSLLALRQQRRLDFVAQNERINSAVPESADRQQTDSPVAQSTIEARKEVRSGAEGPAVVDSSGDKTILQDNRSSLAPAPAETTGADVAKKSSLKDSTQSKESYDVGESRPVFAPEPKATPAPPKPALDEAKLATVRKEEVSKREVQALPREEEKNQPRDEAGRQAPSRSNATLPGSRRADGFMTERAEPRARSKKDSDDEVETRTVSGRHFRRQGNAWIDTAYDSSQGTINVSRGSEQFRALVADEPAIRTFSEKLSGVVIVVWNRRAYRIQ